MNVNLKNWKTAICGGLSICLTALSLAIPAPWDKVCQGLATAFGGVGLYFSKDATTGSVPQ